MNDKQKLEHLRFLREDCETQLRVNEAELAFLRELRFWNDLAMTIKDYDIIESYHLLNWVRSVIRTNYPKYAN